MKKLITWGLGCLAWVASAQPVPFTDQDRILNGLVSNHPTVIEGQAYIAVLQSTRVWVVNPGQSLGSIRPNFIYATAWYDRERNGLDTIRRITFNGMPLQELPNRFGPSYALKQVIEGPMFEEWINWYAFFDPNQFPQYISADALFGQPRWTLEYPPPYNLRLPSPLRIGAVEWSFEMAPAYATQRAPQYGSLKLYPSRTWGSSYLAHLISSPGSVVQRIPQDGSLAGSGGGWVAGVLQGYAGVSACNERSLDFGGGATVNRVLIKACTLVASPVSLEVVAPR